MVSILIVCPVLIYHLWKYHTAEFNQHGPSFIIYAAAVAVYKLYMIIDDGVIFTLISDEIL